jgi:hypothetical protein
MDFANLDKKIECSPEYVYLCIYKTNRECVNGSQFLQFIMNDMNSFPQINCNSYDNEVTIKNKCIMFIQKILQNDQIIDGSLFQKIWRGYIQKKGENHIFIIFDCSLLFVNLMESYQFMILDQIINIEQIEPYSKSFFLENPSLYSDNYPLLFYNIHMETHEITKIDDCAIRSLHPKYGNFFYFVREPTNIDTKNCQKFAIFINNKNVFSQSNTDILCIKTESNIVVL